MPVSRFCAARTAALLWSIIALPFASIAGQGVRQDSASVTINPAKMTIHVGKKQHFKAVVDGTQSTGIRWAVREPDGGQITEDGIYTAPRHVGLYHVVATSEENPAAQAVVNVTVVTEYDTPDWLRNPK